MNHRVVVIAPHPDDETLGVGGSLLRHRAEGSQIFWIIVTTPHAGLGYSEKDTERRQQEIKKVSRLYGFKKVFELGLPAAELDTVSRGAIVKKIKEVFSEIQPNTLYVPFWGDAHSDHRHVYESAMAASKWFRQKSISKILMYETLSETEFGSAPFQPNVFQNIEKYLEKKIHIMKTYASELAQPPFPRSVDAIRALALLRGGTSGFKAAESFMLVKETL